MQEIQQKEWRGRELIFTGIVAGRLEVKYLILGYELI